jgi:hypothetical protein
MAANRHVDPGESLVVAEKALQDLFLSPTRDGNPQPRTRPRPVSVPRSPPHSHWRLQRASDSTAHNALQRTLAEFRGKPDASRSGTLPRFNRHGSAPSPLPPPTLSTSQAQITALLCTGSVITEGDLSATELRTASNACPRISSTLTTWHCRPLGRPGKLYRLERWRCQGRLGPCSLRAAHHAPNCRQRH